MTSSGSKESKDKDKEVSKGSTTDLQTLVPSGAGKQKSWLSTIFSGGRLPTRTISSPKSLQELLVALSNALTKLGAKYTVRKSTVRAEVGSALRFEIEVAENRVDDLPQSVVPKTVKDKEKEKGTDMDRFVLLFFLTKGDDRAWRGFCDQLQSELVSVT